MRRVLLLACIPCLIVLAAAWAALVQPFVMPRASHPPDVDPQRLAHHVRYLSVDLHPRSDSAMGHLDRAADYVEAMLRESGGTVVTQGMEVGSRRFRNLVARFGPDHGAPLVIGAHYDSHGSETPGADDNASGVAGLLELARLLGRHPPSQPVELVAFTLEEPPYFRSEDMGSAHHARSLRAQGREPRLMLALEMIGRFSDRPGSQDYPVAGMSGLYGDRGDFIAIVGRLERFAQMRAVKAAMAGATSLPVRSINAPVALEGVDFSDHLSYWQLGMPALMVTDTAFLRNHDYHGAGDTWDKLDYRRMAQVVQAVYAVTAAP